MMPIKIITTGGTIDKIYFDAKSEFQVGTSPIEQILKEANVSIEYDIESVLRKDSLEITEDDRQLIRERVLAAKQDRVLITHGTDTMINTGLALQGIHKTVVMTGSMQPARLRESDAIFNIGYAVAALQLLPVGIYVAMNGQIFNPLSARKNVAEHRFEVL